MQITLDISDELPLERIKNIISELEARLKTNINLIENKNEVFEKKSQLKSLLAELTAINKIEPIEIEISARIDRVNPFLDDDL